MSEEQALVDEEQVEHKKKGSFPFILSVIIIAIVIVFVALVITVLVVDDFKNLGELFNYIGKQF